MTNKNEVIFVVIFSVLIIVSLVVYMWLRCNSHLFLRKSTKDNKCIFF